MNSEINKQDRTRKGVVYKKNLGLYTVRVDRQNIPCTISSKLRKHLVFPTADPSSLRRVVVDVEDVQTVDPIAIGDWVHWVSAGNETGMITEILPRTSKIARRAAGTKPLEQVLVANADQVIPIFAAAHPSPKWNLLDRYLVSIESVGLPAIICITKTDLADLDDIYPVMQDYEKVGYRVIYTSAYRQEGIAELNRIMKGKTSVLIGKSGVGKTSLLNALQPDLGLRVGAVGRETGKGKHTTSFLEMFDLETGGRIVDTPGMREFAFWDVEAEDIAHYFPEMRPFLGQCKFGLSCQHLTERDCAVREAVSNEKISERRYQSYLKLKRG